MQNTYFGSFLPQPTIQPFRGYVNHRPYRTGILPDQTLQLKQYLNKKDNSIYIEKNKMENDNLAKTLLCAKLCTLLPKIEDSCDWRSLLEKELEKFGFKLVKILSVSSFVNTKGFIVKYKNGDVYVIFGAMYDWSKPFQNQTPSLWDSEITWPQGFEEGSQLGSSRRRNNCRVSSRFLQSWDSVKDIIKYTTQKTIIFGNNQKLIFGGHALGAPLAHIASMDYAIHLPKVETETYTFGCPKFCNQYFSDLYELRVQNCWRFYINNDLNIYFPFGTYSTEYQYPTNYGLEITENGFLKNENETLDSTDTKPMTSQIYLEQIKNLVQ